MRASVGEKCLSNKLFVMTKDYPFLPSVQSVKLFPRAVRTARKHGNKFTFAPKSNVK